MARKKVTSIQLPHNYCLITPAGFTAAAVYCEDVFPSPPPESYPTLDEAVDRVLELFDQTARQIFPPEMPVQPGSIAFKITDDVLGIDIEDPNWQSMTKADIIAAFNQCPSIRLTAVVYFWGRYHSFIYCTLQGMQELEQYKQRPEMQELQQVVQSLGAVGTTGNGIVVH